MLSLIVRLERKHVHESEVYVDADGWAHDDEGNRWRVSGAEPGHYRGSGAQKLASGSSSSRLGKERDAAWSRVNVGRGNSRYASSDQKSARRQMARIDRTVDKIKTVSPRVAEMRARYPTNDFLKSLQSQLDRERPLTHKQVAALEKFEARAKTTGAHRSAQPAAPKAPPSAARATAKVPGTPAKSPIEANAQLAAMDVLAKKKPGDKFLQSLRDQIARGRRLSDKQKTALRRNFHRLRMDDEAKLFETVFV